MLQAQMHAVIFGEKNHKVTKSKIKTFQKNYHVGCTDGYSIADSLWGIFERIVRAVELAINLFHGRFNLRALHYFIHYCQTNIKYITRGHYI